MAKSQDIFPSNLKLKPTVKTLTKTFFSSNLKLKPTVVQEVLLGLVFTHVGHLSLNPEGDQQRQGHLNGI